MAQRTWTRLYNGVGGYALRLNRRTNRWWLFGPDDKMLRANMGANRAGIEWAWHTCPNEAKKYGYKGLDAYTLVPRRSGRQGTRFSKFISRRVWKVLCPEVVKLLVGTRHPRLGRRGRNVSSGQYTSVTNKSTRLPRPLA